MNREESFNQSWVRSIVFAAVALLHILLVLLVVFDVDIISTIAEPIAGVLKLIDVEEIIPPPARPDLPQTNTDESIAATMIETDEPPPPFTAQRYEEPEEIEFLRAHDLTSLPVFPEEEIRRATIYPPIALRSSIEGTVNLELFIDRSGNILNVRILRENPTGRGFGAAAVNAFKGIRAKPAEANDAPVAVRYRYDIKFTLK